MMGTKARLFQLVSAVSLDELVPAKHFYRQLDRVLDLSFVRDLVHGTYADAGRPSIDPVVFFTLQLVLFFEDVRRDAPPDAAGGRQAQRALVCGVQLG